MQPDDETRARRQREWRELNEPQGSQEFKLVVAHGRLRLEPVPNRCPIEGEPNRVRLGGRWYTFKVGSRGETWGGHGVVGRVPAVVGLDVRRCNGPTHLSHLGTTHRRDLS